ESAGDARGCPARRPLRRRLEFERRWSKRAPSPGGSPSKATPGRPRPDFRRAAAPARGRLTSSLGRGGHRLGPLSLLQFSEIPFEELENSAGLRLCQACRFGKKAYW